MFAAFGGSVIRRISCVEISFAVGIVLARVATGFASGPLTVISPDGKVEITFHLKSNSQPYLSGERAYYRISYDGHPVLADSPLGLDFKDANPLDKDFEFVGSDLQSQESTWEDSFDAKRKVPDHYNQLTVSLRERNAPGRRLDLIFRAYNEGAAFRYFLSQPEGPDPLVISAENTGFNFNQDASAYALRLDSFVTAYEAHYDQIKLDQIKPESIIGLPLLVQIPHGPWVALLEADLTDYAGMYVGGVPGAPNALISKLAPVPSFDLFSTGSYLDMVVKEHDLGKAAREARNYLILSPFAGEVPPPIFSRRRGALRWARGPRKSW